MRRSHGQSLLRLALLAFVCAGIAGCRHKPKAAPLPPLPAPSTVPLVPAPEPSTPPQVQPVPIKPLPTPPAQPKPKKRKKKPPVVVPAAPAPVEMASNVPPPPPPVNVVGALSAGGDGAPAAQQKAAALIAEVEKRLSGLSAATLDAQKEGVARVKNFLRQAQDALKSGDAEGASTLAGKAKVLLDDLLK